MLHSKSKISHQNEQKERISTVNTKATPNKFQFYIYVFQNEEIKYKKKKNKYIIHCLILLGEEEREYK